MAIKFEARLLGGVSFAVDNQPSTNLPTRVSQAVLIYLLLQRRPIPREKLMDWFFQESDPKQARANLRATLSRIKKQLGPVLTATRDAVGIRDDIEITVDSMVFSNRLDQLQRSRTGGDPNTATDTLHRALALYKGEFLAGFHLRHAPEFENWALMERERLRLLAIEGLQRLLRVQQEAGAFRAALASAEKLLTIEPLLESAHRSKMLLLARTGQRALALRHYRIATDLFDAELGVPLSPDTTALRDKLQRLSMPPPLRLPKQSHHFVGRDGDLARLSQMLLQPGNRLITLLGMGGVGKTRLSLELVRRLHGESSGVFLDGIAFIDLVSSRSADDVAVEIARVMGMFLSGKRPVTEQVSNNLAEQEACLILDNFEHLGADSAEFVATLLRTCPDLKLIVTSRQQLHLYDEIVFDVSGLALEADADDPTVESEAVQLFNTCAARLKRSFEPDTDNRRAVDRICRLMEGVPLGIELSAGWSREFSAVEIARQIEADLDFLATSLRDVPPRQRSLRAVFAYSWRLLPPPEQEALAQLSLFVGSFSEAAALAVTQSTSSVLESLVSHSLLQRDSEGRFSLHPTVVQFSAEKLADAESPMRRFAGHYAALVDGIDLIGHWPTFNQRLPELRFAFENVLVAWHWLLDFATANPLDPEILGTLDTLRRPLRRMYLSTSQIYAGHRLFGAAHAQLLDAGWDKSDSAEKQLMLAKVAVHDADLGRIISDYPRAVAVGERYLPRLEADASISDQYSALLMLREGYRYVGRPDDERAMHAKLERLAYRSERAELIGNFQLERAHLARETGDPAEALELYRAALTYLEPLEDPRYLAIAYDYMGAIYFRRGEYDNAIVHQQRALTYAQDGQLTYTEAVVTLNLALSVGANEQYDEALDLLERSREMLTQMNLLQQLVVAERTRGDVFAMQGRWEDAADAYRAALGLAHELEVPRTTARVVARLPYWFASTGATAESMAVLHHITGDETLNNLDELWLERARTALGDASAETKPSPNSPSDVIDAFLAGAS